MVKFKVGDKILVLTDRWKCPIYSTLEITKIQGNCYHWENAPKYFGSFANIEQTEEVCILATKVSRVLYG